MKNEYKEQIKKHEIALEHHNSIFDILGYLKIIIFLAFAISLYYTFTKDFPTELLLLCGITFILFIFLWFYQSKIRGKIHYFNGIIEINKRHLDRLSGEWCEFKDIGEELIDNEHPYSSDLDVVGEKSLFQFINRTHTWHGRQTFANDLLYSNYSETELYKRQEAILELSKNIEFTNHMEYHFSQIGVDDSTPKLIDDLKDKKLFMNNKMLKFILKYVPPFTFIFILYTLFFQLEKLYLTSVTILMIQTILWAIGVLKTNQYLSIISNLPYKLGSYSTIIDNVKKKDFSSKKLNEIQTQMSTSDLSASQAMKELDKIIDKISFRNNVIIYFIINALLLWDYECAFMLEEWKKKYAHLSEKWFLTLGEFESLLSFSTLNNVCVNTCLPSVANESNTINAQELGHPLLSNESRINNNLKLGNNIFIVSGSNMSGKTTFLRTVGINLVLARTGSFVCAKQMTFSSLKIITSMRITDDLNEGISTFYAELKRIKTIIEMAKKEPNMIFLIDEIFKGTNSVDRLSGAKTVISKLNELQVIGIITTHDLELCDLENYYSRIKNYNFQEYYKDNKIYFDYKIKPGKSSTTNAKYLMKMVGIL